MARIQWVGFDGDDTLWKSEDYYRQAEADFEAILGSYVDLADHYLCELIAQAQADGSFEAWHARARGAAGRRGRPAPQS